MFWKKLALGAAVVMAASPSAFATVWNGTLYYTYNAGSPNVASVTYSYNDSTHAFSVGTPTGIASARGADGIIFDAHGNLLVGGQNSNAVFQYSTGGSLLSTGTLGTNSYHLALDPSGTKVYTSNFEGPLETLPLTPGLGSATQTAITGGDSGITQVAFGDSGSVFYVDGNPNGHGNLGTINLSTGVTTQLYSNVTPAHGLIYDPYSNLITMFGDGYTGTMNATTGAGLKTSSAAFTCDFDQGAVDGHGHALVAGCGQITLLDYSTSGDITNPNYFTSIGGFTNIDDVAPLVGAGSRTGVPEPASLSLLGAGLLALGLRRRRAAR